MSAEAKAEDHDQSMEEILQSIKRIIAEEGDENDGEPIAEPAAIEVMGSDILELTEMVQDDGTVVELSGVIADSPTPSAPFPADSAVMPPYEKKAVAPAKPVVTSTEQKVEPMSLPDLSADALISKEAAAASSASLKSLSQKTRPPEPQIPHFDSPSLRSGQTVEDLVLEALRPMLKSWLDAHLPTLVERMVEKEIRKIANQ